jgi:outer membrane immunogenic protein
MKKLLLVAVAVAAFSSGSALAADMPVKAMPVVAPVPSDNWTGFYAGVNGGYGWGRTSNTAAPLDPTTAIFLNPNLGFFSPDQFANSFHQRGGVVGGQVGYSRHFSARWVAGLETDIQWANVNDDISYGLAFPPPNQGVDFIVSGARKLEWFGTVRGRIGYLATPDLLLYGTAGLAYGKTTASGSVQLTGNTVQLGFFSMDCFNPGPPCLAGSASRISAGWTAGFGFEYRVFGNLTAKLEYLHVDLGGQSVTLASPSPPSLPGVAMAYRFNREAIDLVRVGLNMSFGGQAMAHR